MQVGRYQIEKAKSGFLHIPLPVCIETPFVLEVPESEKYYQSSNSAKRCGYYEEEEK